MPQPLDPLVLCSVCLLLFSNSTKILILEEDRITKLSAPAGRNIGWALRVSLADGREKNALIIQNEKAYKKTSLRERVWYNGHETARAAGKFNCRQSGSNRRPLDYETNATTNCAIAATTSVP